MSEPYGVEFCEKHDCYHGGTCEYCKDEEGIDDETLEELDFSDDKILEADCGC